VSRLRFLADHDLNENIVDGVLRRLPEAEFIRVRDVGLETSPDPVVLQFAAVNGFVVVSHDVNTMTAHAYARVASGEAMAGLLIARQLDPVGPAIDSLSLIWTASETEDWNGQVGYLPI
jgi:hypothetical protein